MSKHVAVLMGGWSNERPVSLSSGTECAAALRRAGYRVTEVDVGRDIANVLAALKPDVAFNALHGPFGESGMIQGLLELAEHARITRTDPAPLVASAVEFVIEGLYAQKNISRTDEWQYRASAEPQRALPTADQFFDTDSRIPRGKKKYYN